MDTPCIIRTNGKGQAVPYARIKINGRRVGIAAMIIESVTGHPVPPGMYVNHHCDNPACIRYDHLYVGTPQQNTLDMWKRKRNNPLPRGEAIWSAKLTENDVRVIREESDSNNATIPELAARYGVRHHTISRVIHRETWRHVE